MVDVAAPPAESGGSLKGKPGKFKCASCGYAAMTAGSLAGHVSMAHPEAPAPTAPVETWPPIDEAVAGAVGARVSVEGPQLVEIDLDLVDIAENVRVDAGDLADLAANIAELGVLQPIRVIGPTAEGRYRAVWGQRRILASRLAKRTTIPALVEIKADVDKPGARRSIEQLAENIIRKDLNDIEEAVALRAVLDADPTLTQQKLADQLGRTGAWVSNQLRLLETAPEVQAHLRAGRLTGAHAKAIAGLDVDLQADFAERVVKSKWSSTDTERNVKWEKESAGRTRDERARGEKHAVTAIAALDKAANRSKATVYVETYGPGSTVLKLLQADGWNAVPSSYEIDTVAKAGSCGCEGVWKVNVPYGAGSATVSPACHDKDHKKARNAEREAQWARDRKKAEADRKAKAEAKHRTSIRLGEILAADPLAPTSLRLAIYALAQGEAEDAVYDVLGIDDEDEVLDNVAPEVDVVWSALEAMSGEQLAASLCKAIALSLEDGWRIGQPVKDAIAELLATNPDSEAAPAKPAKGKKAGAS